MVGQEDGTIFFSPDWMVRYLISKASKQERIALDEELSRQISSSWRLISCNWRQQSRLNRFLVFGWRYADLFLEVSFEAPEAAESDSRSDVGDR